jgi:hypothetical protein
VAGTVQNNAMQCNTLMQIVCVARSWPIKCIEYIAAANAIMSNISSLKKKKTCFDHPRIAERLPFVSVLLETLDLIRRFYTRFKITLYYFINVNVCMLYARYTTRLVPRYDYHIGVSAAFLFSTRHTAPDKHSPTLIQKTPPTKE